MRVFIAIDIDETIRKDLRDLQAELQSKVDIEKGDAKWVNPNNIHLTLKFLGEIKNTGDATARFVRITFTMKNSAGNVIGTDSTYVNSTDLSPGQTSSFECWTETSYSETDSWTHEITWDEESYIF